MSDFLRTPEQAAAYREYRTNKPAEAPCPLCAAEAIKTFTYWKIIPNRFPYDRIAREHDMIVPLRHVTEDKLSEKERTELTAVKRDYLQRYDYFIEATSKTKSIPEHFHIHLLVGKMPE